MKGNEKFVLEAEGQCYLRCQVILDDAKNDWRSSDTVLSKAEREKSTNPHDTGDHESYK